MRASALVTILGIIYAAPQLVGIIKPELLSHWLRTFPRSAWWGNILMSVGTCWFLYLLNKNAVSDFAPYKPLLLVGFGLIGFGSLVFVRDFLAVRGLAVVVLLLAYHVLKAIQWLDTEWRLVITTWAYINIIGAVWISISPWRLRDYIEWNTRSINRLRIGSALRLILAALIVVIGVTAIRSAELVQ